MSIAVPAFLNACIAPSSTGSSVYLVGVPVSAEGRLEAYTVNITDINTPTAKFLGNQTDYSSWSSQSPKACFDFPGNRVDPGSPTLVAQFEPKSFFTFVYPNGTITNPIHYEFRTFVSPKLFSLVGAVGSMNWYAAVKNPVSTLTNSHWTSVRFNASNANSQSDNVLSVYPTEEPLLSVGTFVATSNTPAQGNHIVFDTKGEGMIFTALSSASPIFTGQDRILSLSNPQPVDMNGIKLTDKAIAVTMINDAYILDKAPDNATIIMYKITPSVSSKLQLVSTSGDVPPFSPNMVATAMNSRIVVYGATNDSAASSTFHNFDSVTGSWSGPGLVKPISSPPSTVEPPPSPPVSDSKAPIGAIIGGVVGGLVLISLIAFFFILYRRKPIKPRTDNELPPSSMSNDPRKSDIGTPPMQQNFAPQQKLHEQQAYSPHCSYVPAYEADATNNTHASPAMSPTLTLQSEPVIFQSQQPYTYMPPTIFQPQTVVSSSPVYSTASGTVSPQVAYIPATQIYTVPASAHSPQYVNGSREQSYVS